MYNSTTYNDEYDKYRVNEIIKMQSNSEADNSDNVLIILDGRKVATTQALINICRTVFVCLVLTLGALWFSQDVNEIALQPLEKMIEKVNRIASNPIAAREIKLIK